jgi:DNA processing protein
LSAVTPRACPDCLRRAWLLRALSPHIEQMASRSPGSRTAELLALPSGELIQAAAPRQAERLSARLAVISEAEMRSRVDGAGCWAVCRHDGRFPAALREQADGPRSLVCRGDPAFLERLAGEGAVTIVGARRASGYGRETASSLAADLAGAGLAVLSGMAFGIDASAHRGALRRGLTVAVLGSGADVAYPAAHRALHRQICERGLVISEMPPGAGPWRWSFPARNRIMAALGQMTIVVEAAVRSGSLITAEMASDGGRDVGAVPGPVSSRSSAGTNELLARGACVVRDAQDVLDAMLGPGAAALRRTGPVLEPGLAAVLAALERAGAPDAVAAELGVSGAEVSAALARLELLGYLRCSALGAYTRTALVPPAEATA